MGRGTASTSTVMLWGWPEVAAGPGGGAAGASRCTASSTYHSSSERKMEMELNSIVDMRHRYLKTLRVIRQRLERW